MRHLLDHHLLESYGIVLPTNSKWPNVTQNSNIWLIDTFHAAFFLIKIQLKAKSIDRPENKILEKRLPAIFICIKWIELNRIWWDRKLIWFVCAIVYCYFPIWTNKHFKIYFPSPRPAFAFVPKYMELNRIIGTRFSNEILSEKSKYFPNNNAPLSKHWALSISFSNKSNDNNYFRIPTIIGFMFRCINVHLI